MAKCNNLQTGVSSCSSQNCAINTKCSINALVLIYTTTFSPILHETLKWINSFKNQPTKYAELVVKGARYIGPVKCGTPTSVNVSLFRMNNPHQNRIATLLKTKMVQNLLAGNILSKSYTNFEDIYKDVNNLRTKGMGDLFIYDVTLRIAYGKGIYPTNYVYIHQGAKNGLQKLLNTSCRNPNVAITKIPLPVSQLSAMEIEDFLCIMKNCLNTNQNCVTNIQKITHP